VLDGVSPDTLRDLHQDELRLRRSEALSAASVSVLGAIAWLVFELRQPGGPLTFTLGFLVVIALRKTLSSGRRWWTLSRIDPVTAANDAEAARERATADAATRAARFAAHPAYATRAIIAALIVVAALEFLVVGSVPRVVTAAGLNKARLAAGESWRLLTAAFLHGSFFHLWTNIFGLLVFGRIVEAYSTRSRLLLAYLTAAVVGNLASWWLLPHTQSIGASGGILGLVGFVYALSLRRPHDVPKSYGNAALATMTMTGLVGAIGYLFIDNAAHAGGALAGFVVGWLTVPREFWPADDRSATNNDGPVMSLLGTLAGLAVAAAAVFTATTVFAERSRAVTSLRVNLIERGAGRYDVQLENLKDVPLEAYTLDVYDSKELIYHQWRDERGFDAATFGSGHGPIAPHERRDLPLGDARRPLTHPSVRLVAAAFADGTFEGSATERDLMDERRANVAADASYWIAVIDDALTRPPDQAAALLNVRIGERMKTNAAGRHLTYMDNMRPLMITAAHAPESFAADAAAERARLVHLRDELATQSSKR
jgi:membrane associated rhomboid family serine protease